MARKTEFEKKMIFCHNRLEQYCDYILSKYKYRNNNKKYKRLINSLDQWEKMIFERLEENKIYR